MLRLSLLVFLLSFVYTSLPAQEQSARALLDSLQQLLDATPDSDPMRRGDLQHEMGKIYDDLEEYPLAVAMTTRALRARLDHEDTEPDKVLVSAFNLGLYYRNMQEYQAAIDHFDLVVRRAPNRKLGQAYFQLGYTYDEIGEFAAAIQAFTSALEHESFQNDPTTIALIHRNIARVHLNKETAAGALQALPHLDSSLAHFISSGNDLEELDTRSLVGLAHTHAGDYPEAIKWLEATLADNAAGPQDLVIETTAATNLGMAYRRSGQLSLAEKHFRRALEIDLEFAEGYRPDNYVALDYDNLSTLFLSMGMPDSALMAAQLALYWGIESFSPEALSHNPTLEDLSGTNQLDILTYLQDKARAHRALGDATGDAEQYAAALATFRLADELLDEMRRNQLLEDTRTYWRADARTLYNAAISTASRAEDPEAAFYFMEKARARLLLEELNAGRAEEALPEAVRARLAAVAQRARRAAGDPSALQAFRRLQDSVFRAYPAYQQAQIGATPPRSSRLKEIMGNTTMVEYYVGEDFTLALKWIPFQGLSLVELPAPDVWRPQLRAYREALLDPASSLNPEAATSLYEQLFLPLDLPRGQPVYIIPDAELYLLPFGALLTARPEDGLTYQNWPWVARERLVQYAFSAQLLEFARQRRRRGNGRALALAPVARIENADELPQRLELPATIRTVRHLATLMPTDTLVNAAATRAAFREMADAYSLLHLGTHAYPREKETELLSRFLIRDANDQYYSAEDLHAHALKADLVVMGACETGLGEQLYGEGVASLGRAFARRGAPNLIMSLWSIDDATTDELLRSTYDGLYVGDAPGAALDGAGRSYREGVTNPRFGHPYYWAGLVYYGPALPVQLGTPPWKRWMLYGGMGMLVLGALLWWGSRRKES
ncbi:CHAT domain-containing tetratricopeptide repeat protein [Lewinella sp. W8]|uniref:CHAT domain-containing protein n=1 Tax=Lewinella sp. W8 TaxID=2528208 RepID=UPI001564AA67|nr:CHAT domain-containing tetratricopeptide repeat protein [Lewinella sp. W8]